MFISLGGGYRVTYARRLAAALAERIGDVHITVAGGFAAARPQAVGGPIRWLAPQVSLVPFMRAATVAVVAGGITLYEACALGLPTVAVALVRPQNAAVRAMAQGQALVGFPVVDFGLASIDCVADAVADLLQHSSRRRQLATRARGLVDGRGPARLARLLRETARGGRVEQIARQLLLSTGEQS